MIHVITPCSRPENLPTILASIPSDCRWLIMMDASTRPYQESGAFRRFLDMVGALGRPRGPGLPEVSVCCSWWSGMFGNPCRNQALDELRAADDDWVHFLDDDNLIHPGWREGIGSHLSSESTMLAWGQLNRDGSVRLPPPSEIRLNHIDTAMFMVKWKALKAVRFRSNKRDADGQLAVEVASRHGHKMIDLPLCWYNALR